MDKRFFIVLAVIVLGLGVLFIYTKNQDTASSNAAVSNHVRYPDANGVDLVIYGDFECSVCEPFYYIEEQVFEKFAGQITVTFRHFVLESIHPNARAAARAAEAAGLQGKFFEMHDMLYENQDSWSVSSNPQTFFENYATSLGLNLEQFKTDYASEVVNNTINADYKEARNKGAEGTPTYFLNGKKLNNSEIYSVEDFSAVIEAALNNQN